MSFDPSVFLSTTFTAPSETERLVCPADEYMATVDSVDATEWASKDDPSKKGPKLIVLWSIDDQAAKEACKRDKVIVRSEYMFNYLSDGVTLDMEKALADVRFGKLRDALGLNEGEFAPQMMPGRSARIRVGHETYTTKAGEAAVREQVVAVTRL